MLVILYSFYHMTHEYTSVLGISPHSKQKGNTQIILLTISFSFSFSSNNKRMPTKISIYSSGHP